MNSSKYAKGSERKISLLCKCTAAALGLLLSFSPVSALGTTISNPETIDQSHSLDAVNTVNATNAESTSNTANTIDFEETSQQKSQQKQEPQFYKDSYPSKYFLTNLGFVTPAKLQSPWGDCWAFAITSALESSILKASSEIFAHIDGISGNNLENKEIAPDTISGDSESDDLDIYALDKAAEELDSPVHIAPILQNLPETIDLSERAIAWFSHEVQSDRNTMNQVGEGYRLINPNDKYFQLGAGNFEMIESQLFAGQGVIAESSCPYRYNNYDPHLANSNLAPLWYDIGSFSEASNDARVQDWSVDDSIRNDISIGWRVDEMYKLPSPAIHKSASTFGQEDYLGYNDKGTDAIKGALMEVGSVAISLSMDIYLPSDVISRAASVEPSDHFSYTDWCQFDASDTVSPDHAVAIVGWDDSYPASNFSGTSSGIPPHDGAWLCKNNWGSDSLYEAEGHAEDMTHWGLPDSTGASSGFFWLSYYDHTIGDPTVFTVEPVSETTSSVYQYDYLGASEYRTPNAYKSEVWVANAFTAASTELLESISAQTFGENQSVQIEIYMLPMETDTANADINDVMRSSLCVYEDEITFSNSGFHKIELNVPILIEHSQSFIIAQSIHGIQFDSTDSSYDATFLNLEMAYTNPLDTDVNPVIATAVANPGETFVTINASGTENTDRLWFSLDDFEKMYNEQVASADSSKAVSFGNALIKAYAKLTSMEQTGQIYQTVLLKSNR